jgi:D-alanyl-D-alanine carboxypeptidase
MEFLDITNKSTILYVQEFVLHMNNKAKKIGLANTRFSNPHGLQNALNVSTAKDILLLSTIASSN